MRIDPNEQSGVDFFNLVFAGVFLLRTEIFGMPLFVKIIPSWT